MSNTRTIGARVSAEKREQLDRVAKSLGMKDRSDVIEAAVDLFLDIYASQARGIAERVAEANRPDAVFVPHETVMSDLWERTSA